MTNEELFTDLKQLIEATVSQQMANVATKDDMTDLRTELKSDITGLRAELNATISSLDSKLDAIQDAIVETFTHTAEVTDTTLQDHEQRLRRLEHHAA
jgi:uncharacterized alpha-E superfamily protein